MEEARKVAERLRLPLGAQAWKGQAGEFRGAGVGSSIDFQDHRDYSPGDDPRHINWQAYARTGQYSMKLYREEVRPVVDLFLDVSDSMWAEGAKARRVAEIFYFFVLSTQRSGAALRVTFVKGAMVRPVELDLSRAGMRANAIRVLISDLLFEGEPNALLRSLHERQGTGLVFAPFTRQEEDPGWRGQYDFIDAEKKSRHPHQIGPAVLERYLEAYQRHFQLWKEECRRHQVAMARVTEDADLFKAFSIDAVRLGALEVMA